MSRKTPGQPAGPWLTPAELRVWLAWIRIALRMDHEMNRQLQEDSGLSLSDYHVLTTLGSAPEQRLQVSDLASLIGWERSRLSHHLTRMQGRGLTRRLRSASDGRATDVVLTDDGRTALAAAAPGHVARVRSLFFGGLDHADLDPFAEVLERVYDSILAGGSIPPPPVVPGHGGGRAARGATAQP